MQRVEGVKELFLRRLFAGQKLNVVDQQHVDLTVAIAKLRRAVVLQRDNELVGELFAGQVDDVGGEVILHNAVADRVHEVRLAQTDAAVQEQRIIGVGRGAGDRLRGGVREPVGVADHELFKGVPDIKIGASEVLERPRRRPPSGRGRPRPVRRPRAAAPEWFRRVR